MIVRVNMEIDEFKKSINGSSLRPKEKFKSEDL
jgi:hypothetical protein